MPINLFPLPLIISWIGPEDAIVLDGIGNRLDDEELDVVLAAIGSARSKAFAFTDRSPISKSRDKSGSVYLITDGTLHKIGIAKNVDTRLASLQVGHTKPLEVVWMSEFMDDPRPLEREFHAMFAHRRVRGEWFRLTPKEVAFILGSTR